ncbi:MAG: class II aldolase/adducin family protein [Nitrospirae bacterium]|nr:class II aldolase/adducin family protein [Nitrospirota bacterium]
MPATTTTGYEAGKDKMISHIEKYTAKLVNQGLSMPNEVTMMLLDADISANRPLDDCSPELLGVFDRMNINSLLFARPAEPYWTIINFLLEHNDKGARSNKIVPQDCETRTFFHDIPVIEHFSSDEIYEALSARKSVIIRNRGIASWGHVSLEQAFVSFSSTCFSTYVKFFDDMLQIFSQDNADEQTAKQLNLALGLLKPSIPDFTTSTLHKGSAKTEIEALMMITEAGKAVVRHRLVDSFFGNISVFLNEKIYISQTGSSLEELETCIDEVPIDGSSSAGITASSELSAHKNIYLTTKNKAILHGHPKFSVIMSMHAARTASNEGKCNIFGMPLVSGDIGTGSRGIVNTVPPAIKNAGCALVCGHGVFTASNDDFNAPLTRMLKTEEYCLKECINILRACCPSSLTKFLPNLYN